MYPNFLFEPIKCGKIGKTKQMYRRAKKPFTMTKKRIKFGSVFETKQKAVQQNENGLQNVEWTIGYLYREGSYV